MRGAEPITGRHSFKIDSRGVSVFPRLERVVADRPSPTEGRVSIGVTELDEMVGGGLPLGDTTLVLGPSGVGKTVLGLRFISQGLADGHRCLLLSFQESEDQLIDKAASFGWDLHAGRADGRLEIVRIPPVEVDLNEVGAIVRSELERNSTKIMVLDSLAELVFAARETERLPGYIYSLSGLIRATGASLMVTNESVATGGIGEMAGGLSFLFHNIVMMRYIEIENEMRRAVNVLKMRDSPHAKKVLQFDVDKDGIKVLGELEGLSGALGWTSLRAEESS